MKRIFFLLIPFLALASCVPQSKYDQLKSEKEELEQQVNQLVEEKRQAEIERNKKPYISETKAMLYIKDNYSFYQKDTKYRNVQLRRIADNSFKVSIEECTSKGDFSNDDFFWHSRVRTLTVHSDGKYDF